MGREIRRVPPNWKHPTNDRGHEQPMHDQTFADAFAEWIDTFDRIRRGELEDWELRCYGDAERHPEGALAAWLNDCSVPDPAYYRPYKDEDATWLQVYETVTEGTPVTPPFATKAELVDWLVEKGECYGTSYCTRFSREEAEAFVDSEWAPSLVIRRNADGSEESATGVAAAAVMNKDPH